MKSKFGIFLGAGFVVLATVASATGNFAVRFEAANQQAQAPTQAPTPPAPTPAQAPVTAQAPGRPVVLPPATAQTPTPAQPQAQRAQPSATIGIARIALTQNPATGFGQFQARSSVIAPGTPFHIYFEPTNLATRFENGTLRGSMSVDILVRNARGETVAVLDNGWQVPQVRAATAAGPLTQAFGEIRLNHLNFAEGRYQLVLRIHDDFSGQFVDRVLDVELRQAPVAATQRLSQSQAPAAPQPLPRTR